MRLCEACGSAAADEGVLCIECGAVLPPLGSRRSGSTVTCMHCGSVVSAERNRCDACGSLVLLYSDESLTGGAPGCRKCGKPLVVGYKFCIHCGAKYAEARPAEVVGDDHTEVLETENLDDVTAILDCPTVYLERESGAERIAVDVPAIVGKGSATTCRITGNPAISRQHIRISLSQSGPTAGSYEVKNLGSTNKTLVDGVVIQPNEHAPVHDGSVITLANEQFVFRVE